MTVTSTVTWKSFRVGPDETEWEPASYNIRADDGRDYGRWRRVLRAHPHGLTVISRYSAPPGKAWRTKTTRPSSARATQPPPAATAPV